MPIKFPSTWDKEKNIPCQICLRESLEKGMDEYYGGNACKVCSQCNRNVCLIHYNYPKELCYDCWIKPEEKK